MFELTPMFRCNECKEIHADADVALECCGFDPDGPPSAAELERMGQQRLFE